MNLIKRCRYGLMNFPVQDIWQGRSLDVYQEFSESEVELFRKLIKANDAVLEIGSSIGCHTMAFSNLVGKKGSVLVFEPERFSFYMLCGNIAINNISNVFAFQQAMGEKVGSINIPELELEKNMNLGGTELEHDWSKEAHYPVVCNTIDNLNLNNLAFIKIDTEGMEKRVLEGGLNTIEKLKPIIYCESDRVEKDVELRKYIRSIGYDTYDHYAPLYNPDNLAEVKENLFPNVLSLNLLCVPNEKTLDFDPESIGMPKNLEKSTILT